MDVERIRQRMNGPCIKYLAILSSFIYKMLGLKRICHSLFFSSVLNDEKGENI